AIGIDDRITLYPDQDGRALDRQRAVAALSNALLSDSTASVLLPVRSVPADVPSTTLKPIQDAGNKLLKGPLTLTFSGQSDAMWTLSTHDLSQMLLLPDPQKIRIEPLGATQPRLDQAKMAEFVARVAKQIDRPSREAKLT